MFQHDRLDKYSSSLMCQLPFEVTETHSRQCYVPAGHHSPDAEGFWGELEAPKQYTVNTTTTITVRIYNNGGVMKINGTRIVLQDLYNNGGDAYYEYKSCRYSLDLEAITALGFTISKTVTPTTIGVAYTGDSGKEGDYDKTYINL